MPDLGDYGLYVLSAYGGAILLLGAIVVLSVIRSRKVRAELDRVERGGRKDG